METVTEFCLLGRPVVCRGGVILPVAGKQRAVLAALLLSANQTVSFVELTQMLWGSAPPPSARVAVQNHVMRLRKALGDGARIRTHPDGYEIRVADGELDVCRFEAHLAAARVAARDGFWDAAAGQARAGLALWRGEPLAGVESDLLATRDVPRLAELRLQAVEIRLEADLHLGRHAELITELQRLAAADPLRERLHGLLMLALYRDGRQAEALAAYARARQILVDELGIEPGAGLRGLQQQVLNGDPALDPPAQPPGAAGSPAPSVPRQLPAAVSGFAGRATELAALTRMLEEASAESAGTVVISAIGGTAGVGKTALALHWAHRVAGRFTDGQLYVNLRGFDPSGVPMAAAEALRGFLDALGVPPDRIPAQPEARAGLYRSLLADRAMLIVLDNARDEGQVRPLLPASPASPASLVIVTSRNQLGGLPAADRARLLTLDVLSQGEAVHLLTARIGAARAATEPAAVGDIAALCGRLPLALAVAAARAEARPDFPLAAVAAELQDRAGRLDALDAGDPGSNVRAVFSWSYRQLSGEAARIFRLLGIHPARTSAPPPPTWPRSMNPKHAACWPSSPARTWPPSTSQAGMRCTTCCAPTPPIRPANPTASMSATLRSAGCWTTTCTPPAMAPP
jgi:DNA-binding SARP family transcriptional activator